MNFLDEAEMDCLRGYKPKEPTMPKEDRISVNTAALRELLQALIGPPHLIRELQVISGMSPLPKEGSVDPLGTLLGEFNEEMVRRKEKVSG